MKPFSESRGTLQEHQVRQFFPKIEITTAAATATRKLAIPVTTKSRRAGCNVMRCEMEDALSESAGSAAFSDLIMVC